MDATVFLTLSGGGLENTAHVCNASERWSVITATIELTQNGISYVVRTKGGRLGNPVARTGSRARESFRLVLTPPVWADALAY